MNVKQMELELQKCCLILDLDYEDQQKKAAEKALSSSASYSQSIARLLGMYRVVIHYLPPDRLKIMEIADICWEKDYPLQEVIGLLNNLCALTNDSKQFISPLPNLLRIQNHENRKHGKQLKA